MPRKLSLQERIFVVKTYWKTGNAQEVIRQWSNTYETSPPARAAIYDLRDKFDALGTVADAPRSGRPAKVVNEENEMLVAQAIAGSPRKSARRCSIELNINRRSVQMLLHKLKYKPYIPRLIHGLIGDDGDRRMQFCELFQNQCTETPDLLDKIVWSDEAQFKLSGHVNRHNCIYWSSENNHVTIEKQLNQPGITVWAGLSSSGIVGPVFFQGNVTGAMYLETLQTAVVPILQQREDFHKLYFQQDGAPPHYATTVRNYLDETFEGRWIGRRGSIDWPARSPDLTPLDFCIWGVVKDRVYSRTPRSIDDLRAYITDALADIDRNKEFCQKVCRSVLSRCTECIEANGLQFEQFH